MGDGTSGRARRIEKGKESTEMEIFMESGQRVFRGEQDKRRPKNQEEDSKIERPKSAENSATMVDSFVSLKMHKMSHLNSF